MSEVIMPSPQNLADSIQALNAWVGRFEDSEDLLSVNPVMALSAALGEAGWEQAPTNLPALRHWLYFPILTTLDNTAEDGHAKKGGFLPPVPLPRRMWAGSDVDFLRPLGMAQPVFKRSSIKSIQLKQGSTGALVFVDVEHRLANGSIAVATDNPAVVDLHHIVYREAAPSAPTPASPKTLVDKPATSASNSGASALPKADWAEHITPDAVLLFRYSALTYNSHRIHYDLPYVTQVEGYPGLVTHGPLQATLLLDAAVRAHPGKTLKRFSFKALAPSFAGESLKLEGKRGTNGEASQLWLLRGDGSVGLKGTALFS
jgi:3-methylfumaryl-CoA hydratase